MLPALGDQYLVGFRQDLTADLEMLQAQDEAHRAQLAHASVGLEFFEGRAVDPQAFFERYSVAAIRWATFAVAEDPSRSGHAPVAIHGSLRLGLELSILGLGALALHDAGFERAGLALAVLVVLHYATSCDRIAWLPRR